VPLEPCVRLISLAFTLKKNYVLFEKRGFKIDLLMLENYGFPRVACPIYIDLYL
jgi:hypothetical protein